MTKYLKYQSYTETDYSHIGVVPSHWKLKRTKFLFERQNRPPRDCDDTVTAFRDGQVTLRTNRRTDGFTQSLKEIGYQGVRCGDLVVHAMDGFAGAIGVSDSDGKCSPVYSICKPVKDSAYSKYYGLYLRNLALNGYVESLAKGIRERSTEFRYAELKEVWLPEPPIEEQTQIANFLDHETAKIDTLIDKQQQLIKLLKEKRQAVISHAVTKGLNPDAPMKDSGVEWLGEVPEHWGTGKLGYFSRISNGATPSRDNMTYWQDGTIGWLNSSKVNDVIITEADQFITPLALAQTSVQKVDINDLVVAITGEGQTRGRVAICRLEATINQHLAGISIRDKRLKHDYLFFWLTSQYSRIRYESDGAGSTKGAITCSDIVSYPVPLPPLNEQEGIVTFLRAAEERSERLLELSGRQIELLRERRTALISAAVTGKFDVRNACDTF